MAPCLGRTDTHTAHTYAHTHTHTHTLACAHLYGSFLAPVGRTPCHTRHTHTQSRLVRLHSQARYAYPSETNPLLSEAATYVEAAGLNDPFQKIYITTKPLDDLQLVVFLYVVSQLPKFAYDPNTGTHAALLPTYTHTRTHMGQKLTAGRVAQARSCARTRRTGWTAPRLSSASLPWSVAATRPRVCSHSQTHTERETHTYTETRTCINMYAHVLHLT
jgi:hypothetical protein